SAAAAAMKDSNIRKPSPVAKCGTSIRPCCGGTPDGVEQVSEPRLPFESHGVSHRGCVRALNEDSYIVEPRLGLWAVADGMGGHEAGEVASASIVHHLATIGFASSAPDLRARFGDRLAKAHAEIRQLSRQRGVTIGSTVAALLVRDGNFACIWS